MTDPTPATRLSELIRTTPGDDRYDRMIDLATALEAEGMHQRDMFILFHREQEAARRAEDDALDDVLGSVIDRVTGWCEKSERIFAAEEI